MVRTPEIFKKALGWPDPGFRELQADSPQAAIVTPQCLAYWLTPYNVRKCKILKIQNWRNPGNVAHCVTCFSCLHSTLGEAWSPSLARRENQVPSLAHNADVQDLRSRLFVFRLNLICLSEEFLNCVRIWVFAIKKLVSLSKYVCVGNGERKFYFS